MFTMLLTVLILFVSSSQFVTADANHGHGVHVEAAYDQPAYCGNGGYCVPPVFCSPWYQESLYDPAAPCYLAPGTPGVCCVTKNPPCKFLFE